MRHPSKLHLAAALVALLLGPAALAADKPLSFAEAQRLAVERSQQLNALGLGVTAAREMAVAAGQLPDPVLSIGIENVPIEGPDRFRLTAEGMTMRRIGVMQELPRREKRELRARRYELEAQKGLTEQEAARAMIQRDTAMAWLEAWYAERMAAAVAELRLRGLQEVQASEAEYRAGRGMQADVLMARAGVAMLDDRAAEMERKVKTARTMLARWTGVADAALDGAPDISRLGEAAHGDEDDLARHPELAVLAQDEAIADSEARLARANRQPDWSVELAWQNRSSPFGDMVSLMARVPLPWDRANRQDRELAARLAMAQQAAAQREEAVRRHVAEVRTMVQEWESNRSRLTRYEREIIPLATQRSDAALSGYKGAKTNVSEVIAARRAELDIRLQALQLEAETARLWAQLNYLVAEKTQ